MFEFPVIRNGLIIGEIDVETQEIMYEHTNLINFSCTSRVECCSNLKIPITNDDVQQILDNGYELDQIIETMSPMILPIKGTQGKTEKVYPIKRKPFDNTCTFLESGLCKIHAFKPFACKIYPFSVEILSPKRVVIKIHEDSLCKSIVSANSDTGNNKKLLIEIKELIVVELQKRGFMKNIE